MTINACIICKDDTEYPKLLGALDSIRPHVDGIYLTTTGKDVSKIKTIKGVHHSHFDWVDDFAAARNFNFAQAPQDSDFLFWIDADDVLVGGEHLRSVAELAKESDKDVIFFSYWYGCRFNGEPVLENLLDIEMTQMRERLLRPGVTTWKGRLHETPVPVDGSRNKYTQVPYKQHPTNEFEFPIAVMHTTEDKDLPEKMARNKRILELQLADERAKGAADPRTLVYLMKIYAEQELPEDWAKVEAMGQEYLAKSGWDEERGAAWEQMGIVAGKQGNFRRAVECFHQAIEEWPHQVLLYLRLAMAYYNLSNFKAVQHWLDVASQMDMDKRFTSSMTNMHAIKVLFAQLLMNLNYNHYKDVKKAYQAAKMLYQEHPSPENDETLAFLESLDRLNDACSQVDQLVHYLDDTGQTEAIVPILDALPRSISSQPFVHRLRHEFTPPRVWDKNEICYFANFGAKHFEEWGPGSLERGIGGSETAVIRLAQEWAKQGFKVTVYGDPGEEQGEHEGVTYLPWYHFNPKDRFNVLIQWRSWSLAGQVTARKFLVDLHDVYSQIDIKPEQLQHIDKFMVKSFFHRNLAPIIPDSKITVISNGI